jgi:hypothetical protein
MNTMAEASRAHCGRWRKSAQATLCFLAALLLFDRLLFLFLRAAAYRYYDRQSVAAGEMHVVLQQEKPQGLIFGTSRAQRGISQKLLAQKLTLRIHNEARAGKYPAYNQLFFERMRADLGELRFVVYSVDYFMFDHRTSRKKLARLRKIPKKEVLNPQGMTRFSPISFARFSLLWRLKPEIDEFFADLLGWDAEDEANASRQVRRRRQRRERSERLQLRPPTHWERREYRRFPGIEGQQLVELLRELSSRRIATFLVMLPDYIGTNATNYEQAAFKRDVRGLAARFASVSVLDFNTADRAMLNDPGWFADGGWGFANSHLSTSGRHRFTSELAAAIRRRLSAN